MMDPLLNGMYYAGQKIYGVLFDAVSVGATAILEGPTAAISEAVYRGSNGLSGLACDAVKTSANYLSSCVLSDFSQQKAVSAAETVSNEASKLNELATGMIGNTCPIDKPPLYASDLIAPGIVFLTSTHYLAKSTINLFDKLTEKTFVYCPEGKCEIAEGQITIARDWIDIMKTTASTALCAIVSYTAANGMVRHLPSEIQFTATTVFATTAAAIALVDLFNSRAPTACCKGCEKTGGSCQNEAEQILTPAR